jgi:hypothetical protein
MKKKRKGNITGACGVVGGATETTEITVKNLPF